MNDASSLQILARSSHGCVQRCGCCEKLCLQFQRVMLPLTPARLQELRQFLQTTHPSSEDQAMIQLRFSEVLLMFSREEIAEMITLLTEAELELARAHLQRSFDASSAELPFSDAEVLDF
jgi:hypothetical protein